MAARYEVRLKDTTGATVAIFDDWISLTVNRQINAPDSHVFEISGGAENAARVALFILDAQLEVWRKDDAAAIVKYLEYEGFHRNVSEGIDSRGQRTFISEGVGYEDLLDRRIVQNYLQSAEATKVASPAETVMKEYVDEQAGPGANIPPGGNRLFESGITVGLAIQADAATGPNWSGSKSYRNLLSVEQEVSEAGGMWFDVIGTGAAIFQFRAGLLPYGNDRTTTGLNPATGLNGAGNSPVIFSDLLNTARNPTYTRVRHKEGNRCLALGSGAIDNRNLRHVIPAPDPGLDSPWNNREIKAQASQDSSNAALDDRAASALEVTKTREKFDFDVEQAEPLFYGRDYFLGDEITAVFDTIISNRTIVGIEIVVARSGEALSESIRMEFADVVSTSRISLKQPMQAINERVSSLEALDIGAAAAGGAWDNVVIVAASGGDFTLVSTAIASITDNVAANRYCIFVMPAAMVESVTMKPYIDVVGIDKHTVRLHATGAGATVVTMVANSSISNLTIDGLGLANTVGLDCGVLVNVHGNDLYIRQCLTAMDVQGGEYENIWIDNLIAGGDGIVRTAGGGIVVLCRNCHVEAVDRAFDVNGLCQFFNCYFQGEFNYSPNVTFAEFYAQDCYIRGDTEIFRGGGNFVNCFFTGVPPILFNNVARVWNCTRNAGEGISVTAVGSEVWGMVGTGVVSVGAANVSFRNCDTLDITVANFAGFLTIVQCDIDELAYTAGVQTVRLHGNTYQQAPATNVNRTFTGNDVVKRFFPVSSVGTGVYTSHGTHVVHELNAAEVCFLEIYLPTDFLVLLDALFRVIPTGAGTFDWTVDTTGGTQGEDEAAHNDTDTANLQATVDDQLLDVSCILAFDPYLADDNIGAEITIDALGVACTAVNVLGMILEYIKTS